MGDDSEWMKLPTDEKVQHKVWKARLAGYEEATKLFKGLEEKSPEFGKYGGLMRKFVIDSNAVAQEKALDAVLLFVTNSHTAGRSCADVMNGIVTKCLNASKQKTKDKAMETIMMYVEIEKQEAVQEALMAGLENKQPKIVVGCITALRIALRDFGTKIITVKPIIKVLPKLLEDRDKSVREETKLLCIELYRWIGAALKPQMTHFKPVQVQELETEFEKLPSEKAKQARFLRSQQDLKAKMEEEALNEEAGGGGDAEDDGASEEIDAYELIEAVDILALLPKDFYDKIEAKKWQERKEALEALQKLTENPKIENGDFAPLIKCVLKVIAKDTNVMLVALAGKCLKGIAVGLRKKFSPYAGNSMSTIIDKFKEKKPAVVTALREASDAVYQTTTLENISEDCVAALENKNPQIRAETALFLGRCFQRCTQSSLPKKMLKMFCTSLLKTVNDTTGEVREASFQALGTAMKVVTEKNITPFLNDVDNIKMAKIQECCTNAVLLNAKGEPRGGSAAAGGGTASAPSGPKIVKPKAAAAKQPEAKPSAPESSSAKVVKPGGKKKPAAGGKGGKAGKKGSSKEEVVENALSDEALEEKAAALLPGDTLASLTSSNWKERLAGMEKMTQVVKGLARDDIPCQVCVRVIDRKPGLKDTNFQVLKLRLELIAHLAKNSVFSKRSAEFCLSEIVDKIGDVKNGGAAQEALSCIAEAIGLDYVSQEVVKLAFTQKNPKNQSEALNWLALSVKEFGLKINIKPMLETIKKAFAATNPAVRTSAISLLGVVYMYMGSTLRTFFESEKPALLQQIDAEFEKVKDQKPNPPTRGLSPAGSGDGDEDDEEKEEAQEVAIEDLVPRTDIIEKITPELLEQMADKNWKERGEALSKVTAILNEAKFITANIGTLPDSLKLRLADSNKIMVNTTIGICQTLGTAMGPHCKNHVRVIAPGLISCMGDTKPQVRTAATNALNVWIDQTTLTPLVESEALSDALKVENPNLRTELLSWLCEKLPTHRVLPTEIRGCIPNVLACLEDRNGDVRKKAQDALVPFMIHTGYDSFLKASSKLKPASKDQIMAILEKARGNLPAKAPKSKKSAPAAAPTQASQPNSRFDDIEDDEPAPAKETKKEQASKKVVGKGKAKAPAASNKKKEEEDLSPIMTVTVPKEQRFKEERNLKVLKWNFTEIRPEIIEQLNLQMEKNFNKTIMGHLFHKDFKFHIKAIELLSKNLENLQDETLANLDLILKWYTLRFYDTNPSMLNKALGYLQDLFVMLADIDYHLHDLEAAAFIPYLIIKVGDSKDNVRRDVRQIFKLLCQVYPASKMFTHLIDGLKSKNSKQRAECLEELGCLIDSYGIAICQPTPGQALKSIASQISDRDNSVRNAALNTIVIAYGLIDEQVFKYVGNLNDKDMSFLQERLKKAASKPKGPKINNERPQSARPAVQPQQPSVVQRPHTAQGKVNHTAHKKQFLDVDIDDSDISTPDLIQVDIDDIYEKLPTPTTTVKPRPLSTTIGFVISQITNKNINTCIQALAQIDEVLKDKERSEILIEHVDQLVLLLSMQFKMVYSTCMGDESTSKDDVIRLYRCLLCTLLATFQHEELAKKVSKDILKDTLNSLVTILLDSRLMDLDEGPQVVRTVNVTVIKIVENADYTNIMSALISLLQDCAGSETCTPKFLELIMKCLWRLMRMLPNTINELNIERTLLDCHQFLRAFPSSSWKERSSDLPLRTIKTILHSLATLKGKKILTHTSLISSSENSEIEAYLQKILKNDVASTNAKNDEMNTEEKPQKPSKSRVSFSKGTQDSLGEIFKKIGSKENTKEGLNDLYDFKKKHPDADLMPFLKKTSQFFQDYVERGLKNIELEREGKKFNSGDVSTSSTATTTSNSSTAAGIAGSNTDSTANFYLERLKAIRSQCGLDNSGQQTNEKPQPLRPLKLSESGNNSSTCSSTESLTVSDINYKPEEEENEKPAASAVDVTGLKMRLERIKQLSNKN
ncbi:hypothetical protein LOTGIDRAFT_228176 [Lottia gigantea]|uniref:TOG domain-containing protein n=1 Tax=Lottia gigantea TaxID=225164 RepID=V4AK68_LOTGI|nr:hypothetical protein LOTGIDRAFT_228176 [Lottia gigantea]ESO97492.1 hypothetical protein LOTGIDRAFT_228176 [Lottia gigantea]